MEPPINAVHVENMKTDQPSKLTFTIIFKLCHTYHTFLITLLRGPFLFLIHESWKLLDHGLVKPFWASTFLLTTA